jgi:tape measure domain-containing protein|nr:MAG TPA: tail tape measure protein [Caudoviricetes sp.]
MAAETIVIEVRADFKNNMGSGMSGAKSQVDKFNQSVDKSKEKIKGLGGEHAQPKVSLIDRASSTLNKLNSGLRTFGSKTWRAGVKVIDYATRPLRGIKNMLFSIKSLAVAVGGALMFKKGIMEPINLADAYSSAKIGFSTLLGEKKGQKMMNDLDKFAEKTPFKTSNTIAQAQKLVAMGWDAKDIVKDMYTIGDAAAATGKGDEGLQRIALALSQIKSKGKLSTEELNQLAEAGISAKRYIAEGLGYGSGDKALAKMSKDLEDGKIMANEAITAILKGMKEYKGMMDKTANETVEGLKSQIEDAFEINVFRRWGQGLQDGAKRGLGSIVELLDKSKSGLKSVGDSLYDIGKQLSNFAADKLEGTIDKIMKLTDTRKFKDASVFGKIGMIAGTTWDELIAKPFGSWWDSSGKPYIEGKFKDFGKMMGKGLTNATTALGKGILTLLGVDTSGMEIFKDASDVGSNFSKGFAEGFDGKKVMNTIKDVFVAGFKSLFNGKGGVLGNIIKAGITLKMTAGVLSALSTLNGLWKGTGGVSGSPLSGGGVLSGVGLKGLIGSASNGTGLLGWGALTGLKMGAGISSNGIVPLGYTSAIGLGATAGGILGGIGLYQGGKDVYKAIKANNSNDKRHYGWRGGTKIGMVGAGAAAGAAIGSVVPVLGTAAGALIGAGIGGIGALWKGDKLADSISGVTKSTKELNEEAEKLAKKDMKKRFGEWSLSADEVSSKVKKIVGEDTIRRVNKFNQSMSDLNDVRDELADKKYTIDYASAMIKGGGKLSKSDVEEYKSALEGYASATKNLLTTNKKSTRSAFQLLYGDDSKGMAKMTKGMEKTYSGLEGKLAKKSAKLNDVIAKAFEDGKITIDEQKKIEELVGQIEDIQDKVEERVQKVAEAEAKASYDLIKQKYSYKDLTPDSFKTLVDELNAQNETNMKAYDDAYIKAKAEIDVEFKEGTINEKQYKKKLKEIEDKWRNGKAETIKASVNVSLDVLKTNYSDSFSKIEKALSGDSLKLKAAQLRNNTTFSANGLEYSHWDKDSKAQLDELKSSFLSEAGIDKKMQKEMKDLYDSLKPQEKDLQELKKSYEDAGEKVPQWIEDSLADIENVKLMSGDSDSFYTLIGEQLAKEDSTHAKQLLEDKGSELPKALKEGIENGLKEVEGETKSVEVDTNLKLKADKKNIDTSNLDKSTKSVVDKLKDKGIIKIDKKGKVKIKTKDGKIDTSGLDKQTKKAVRNLEKKGIIKIDKKGNVTIKPKKVDTKKLNKATTKAAKSLEKKGLVKINKKGKVSITKKGGINTKNLNKQTKKAVKALEKAGVLKIDKKGNVTVKAKKVDTTDVEKKSKDKTNKAVKGKKATGTVDVTMKESSTDTSDPKSKSKSKTKDAVTGLSVNGSVSVSMGLASVTGIASIVSSVKDKILNGVSNIKIKKGHKRKFANGGYVNGATLSLIGEDGPEMVIPLGAKRRNRGKHLLKQAAHAMGVPAFADGGIVGGGSRLREMMNDTESGGSSSVNNAESSQTPSRNGKVEINVGGVTIEINSSGDGIPADIENNKDRISSIIADALEQAWQNMPLASTD